MFKSISFVTILLVFALFSGIKFIPTGEIGFTSSLGVINTETREPGATYVFPIFQNLRTINVQRASYNESMTVLSEDSQKINVVGVVNYNLNKSKAAESLTVYGSVENLLKSHLNPTVDTTVRQILNKYSMNEILANQGRISSEIQTQLTKIFTEAGFITFDQFQISAITVDEDVQRSIEQTAIAKQRDIQQEFLLKVSEKQAQINANNSKGLTPDLVKLQATRSIVEKWNGQGIIPNSTLLDGTPAVTAPTK
jgi:regulator of protease activity HflC (stomatin/prohibitin superfamily)